MAKLFVPDELLEKLHCSICSLNLSIFPIFIRKDGGNPICGRCKIPNENEYLRDEAYEGIAQFLIFPCSYTSNGCDKQLTPLKLKEHEKCCTFRKLDCPSKNYTRCSWQGPNDELKAHFESFHPTLLLTSRKFEIQFVSSTRQNFLMPFEEELFIIKPEVDSRTGIFVCFVEHVVLKENSENYNYFIRVEADNGTYYYKCPERSTTANAEDQTKLTVDFIKEHLHDPTEITASIEILKVGLKEDISPSQGESNTSEIDLELLSELECPVCLEYMLPPILQCLNGHSICSNCRPRITLCPICKSRIGNTQNFALEKLTVRMSYPCRYHKVGCSIILKSSEIRIHERTCEYGPYDCPIIEIDKCPAKCSKSEIIEHVQQKHPDFVLKGDKVSVPIRIDTEFVQYYLIIFAGRLFKLCFKFKTAHFYWAVQLIGPSEESRKFKFEIDIIDNSVYKLRQYARGRVIPYGLQHELYRTRGTYITFSYEQIECFITDNLSYRIRVIKE